MKCYCNQEFICTNGQNNIDILKCSNGHCRVYLYYGACIFYFVNKYLSNFREYNLSSAAMLPGMTTLSYSSNEKAVVKVDEYIVPQIIDDTIRLDLIVERLLRLAVFL